MDKQLFINTVKNGAIQGQKNYGILASVTISQSILESGWGQYARGNNLFGIKWSEGCGFPSINLPTREFINGQMENVQALFRKYPTLSDSILDHAKLLNQSRYASVKNSDYHVACQQLQVDGYATDPNYAKLLISIIDSNNLTQYDKPRIDQSVVQLQTDLNTLFRFNLVIDGIRGNLTNSAVNVAKRVFNITSDATLLQAIAEVKSRPTDSVPSPHHEYATRWIQNKLGYIAVDGVFGNITKVRVQNFQASYGLVPDGIVGPKTWTRLFE